VQNEGPPRQNLSPEQQLLIAAKVSRLSQVTPETFDEQIHIADAQDLVRALDPIIKPTDRKSRQGYGVSYSNSRIRAGATNAGNINASISEKKTKEYSHGVNIYRIGRSNVTKFVNYKNTTNITLENWTHEELGNKIIAGVNIEQVLRNLQIEYDSNSLEVVRISQMVPEIKQKQSRGTVLFEVQEQATTLWQKPNYRLPRATTQKSSIRLRKRS